MSDDRSERLRNRRKRAANKAKEGAMDNTVKPDKPDKTGNPDKTESSEDSEEEEVTSAKDRDDWGPIQMHLPDDLRDELELAFDEKNLRLRKEGGEKLQKLLHYYPLVVSAGIDAINEMDVNELKEEAKSFE